MVSHGKSPLLLEAEVRLGRMERGGIRKVGALAGLPEHRLRQMARGVQPTGSKHHGPAHQQVQRVVYQLRKLQDIQAPPLA
jgi:hypothetical protein